MNDLTVSLTIVEYDAMCAEIATLRAQLVESISNHEACKSANTMLLDEIAAIAATEPVAYRWVWKSKPHDIEGWCYTSTPPNSPELQEIEKLFTRPMPAEIATTEPVASHYFDIEGNLYTANRAKFLRPSLNGLTPLFARPMPAQDVTELVEALEEYGRAGVGNSTDWRVQLSALRLATAALSKGAK